MSIEYFRPEINRPIDADGFEIDSATREIAEIDAWLNEQPSPPEPFEPSDEDWSDYARYRIDEERNDALRRMEDADYEARMRFG